MPVQRKSTVVVKLQTTQFIDGLHNEIVQRVYEAAQVVRNIVVETLSGPRSGRVYRIPGTKRTYVASAPGEPPAVRLGDLRKSIKTRVIQDKDIVRGYVGSPLPYSDALEFGTSRIKPRPYMRPSFKKATPQVKAILKAPFK